MEKETVTVVVAGWAYEEVLDTPVNIYQHRKKKSLQGGFPGNPVYPASEAEERERAYIT